MKFLDRRYTPRAYAEPVKFRWRLYSQDERGFFILKKYLTVKNISSIAILAALGAVLMLFDFPIAIAPSFYKLDFADIPCLIGSFALGPVPALFIQVIKILIKMLLKPTSTAFVGELAAFITSCSLCIPAAYIYSLQRDRKGAVKAMIVGVICMIVAASVANYYFIIPAYVNMFSMSLDAIIEIGSKIFPVVKDKFSFVLFCVAPFNLIKGVLVCVVTSLLYKHISPLLR